MTSFQVVVVWNRTSDFVPFGPPHDDLDRAIEMAKAAENMGDGASIKKARVVNSDGYICWQYGKKTQAARSGS